MFGSILFTECVQSVLLSAVSSLLMLAAQGQRAYQLTGGIGLVLGLFGVFFNCLAHVSGGSSPLLDLKPCCGKKSAASTVPSTTGPGSYTNYYYYEPRYGFGEEPYIQ